MTKIRTIALLAAAVGMVSLFSISSAESSASGADADPSSAIKYLRPIRVIEPEELSDSELQHIQTLRADYGLSTEPAFIRSLYEQPSDVGSMRANNQLLGSILFTEAELDHAFRRAAAEWVGGKVDLLAFDLVDGYAGTVIQPDATIRLQCAACEPASTSDLIRSMLTVSEPFLLEVVKVDHSTEELLAIGSGLSEQLQELNIAHGGVVDPDTNSIRILLPDSERDLPFTLPETVQVEYGFKTVDPDINKNDYIIYGLVEGGQQISGGGSGNTTSGFTVNNGNRDLILVAGHLGYPNTCQNQFDLMYQGGQTLGHVTGACQYGGNIDAALVQTSGYRANYGRVHYTSSQWRTAVTFGVTNHNLTGVTVCQTGWATTGISGNANVSARCGTVSSMNSTSPCGNPNPAWTLGLGIASYQRLSGDSGAAVVWPTGYGYGAAGSHSCVGFNGTGAVFSLFSRAANLWNLTISPAL